MQILVNNKPAAIKKDSSFEINLQSAYFTDSENFSLNIDFPLDIKENRAIFGTVVDLNGLTSNVYSCYIIEGDFEIDGYLQILSVQNNILSAQFVEDFIPNMGEGLSSIYLDELSIGNVVSLLGLEDVDWASNLSIKDQQMIFPNTWDPEPTTVYNLADYGVQCLQFTSDDSKYNSYLSVPGTDESQTPVFQLYMWKLFDLLTSVVGYKFNYPPIDCFSKILICNATDQGIKYEGFLREDLDLAKNLPHWTISEFLTKLGNMFGCSVSINHRSKNIVFTKINGVSISSKILNRVNICDNVSIDTIDEVPEYRRLIGFQFPNNNDEDKYNSCQDFFDFIIERGQVCTWSNTNELLQQIKNAAEQGYHDVSGYQIHRSTQQSEDFIKIKDVVLEVEEETPTEFSDYSVFHQQNNFNTNYYMYVESQSLVNQLSVGSKLWYRGPSREIIPEGWSGYGYILRPNSLFYVYSKSGNRASLSYIEIYFPSSYQNHYMDFRLLNQLSVRGFQTLQDLDISPIQITKFETFPFTEDRLKKEPLPYNLDSMVKYPDGFSTEDTDDLVDKLKDYKKEKYQHDRLFIGIFDNGDQDYKNRLIPSVCHKEVINTIIHKPNGTYDYDRYEYLSGIATRQYYLDINTWQQLNLPPIDTSRKYTVHVITNDNLDANHIYIINGDKYICKNVKLTITNQGISQDKELELYRIIDETTSSSSSRRSRRISGGGSDSGSASGSGSGSGDIAE